MFKKLQIWLRMKRLDRSEQLIITRWEKQPDGRYRCFNKHGEYIGTMGVVGSGGCFLEGHLPDVNVIDRKIEQ